MAGRRAMGHQDLRHSAHGFGPETGDRDLRVGKHDGSGVRPSIMQMLFRGGPTKPLAAHDLRMGEDDEDSILPGNEEMLSDGGEVEGGISGELVIAAEDVLHAMSGGPGGENHRARARSLARALHAFFLIAESMPHDEDEG